MQLQNSKPRWPAGDSSPPAIWLAVEWIVLQSVCLSVSLSRLLITIGNTRDGDNILLATFYLRERQKISINELGWQSEFQVSARKDFK